MARGETGQLDKLVNVGAGRPLGRVIRPDIDERQDDCLMYQLIVPAASRIPNAHATMRANDRPRDKEG